MVGTTTCYDSSKASWYQVMGIIVAGITANDQGGVDPSPARWTSRTT